MHRLHQRQKAEVKTQHLVFSMVGYPGDLVWVQSRVDGVQHPAGATDAVVQLKVPVAVPRQRGDTVTERQLQCVQRGCHLPGTFGRVLIGVAVNITFHPARHNFCITVVAFGKFDQT